MSVALDAATLSSEHAAVRATALTPQSETVYEYFKAGTEPIAYSEYWQVPEPPTDLVATLIDDTVTLTFTPPSRYMRYRVYRVDESGFTILLRTVENAGFAVTIEDDVHAQSGELSYGREYRVIREDEDGAPLEGKRSELRRVQVLRFELFCPKS